ncbi:hypothetical protein [Pseudomonas panipatensis]|jgi:hypothetical protein|uniref:Secreted protein n=1 Tax=Pseudomonas panipatensis TaxID=428992 RepID=A0A1G8KL06_9PSED|nr:hypothetical protein [Pseudomonas panipatensis]SDI44078.1 hypothetical protein SAMN05216272_109109 [Pseudomonas panipatensis]SMP69924.1 hypothetical protein SAMN06295951_109109 [Pseudomonas panipatensis]
MKLEITRSLLLLGALGIATLAAAAWHEPSPGVIDSPSHLANCRVPPNVQAKQAARPDHDLLLFLFGLSQGGIAPR